MQQNQNARDYEKCTRTIHKATKLNMKTWENRSVYEKNSKDDAVE